MSNSLPSFRQYLLQYALNLFTCLFTSLLLNNDLTLELTLKMTLFGQYESQSLYSTAVFLFISILVSVLSIPFILFIKLD